MTSVFICVNLVAQLKWVCHSKMAKQQQQQDKKVGFKSITLFKDQTLGIGSYGAVCKAKCDDLFCAAKVLHPTLFDPTAQRRIAPHREHRLPIRRFELECEFLSTIRHPNIVQYLGMHQDPDTGLSVLLMELMDDSLTHFLESSPQPILYPIQVNFCHDIALALSFLHSNNIVHRDLSSNNVLLTGNIRAKVTDFGMARLSDLNAQATHLTFTMCPGTDVYMPPEAVDDKPVYTEKIDCFSFGVITIQILTQQFPKPGDRRQKVQINHPGLPRGMVEVRLAEVDRRQDHISEVDPSHPLLLIALDCLKDRGVDRPSAQQLCERVTALKESSEYRNIQDQITKDRNHAKKVKDLQDIIQSQLNTLEERDHIIRQETQRLEREKDQITEEKEKKVKQLMQETRQLEREKDQVIEEKEGLARQLRQETKKLEREKHQAIKEKEEKTRQLRQETKRLEREKKQATEEREEEMRQVRQEIQLLDREKDQGVEDKEQKKRQLRRVSQQLEESKQIIAHFERQIIELQQFTQKVHIQYITERSTCVPGILSYSAPHDIQHPDANTRAESKEVHIQHITER